MLTHEAFFPQTLNDVTELCTKYAAGNIDSAPQTAHNIITDVLQVQMSTSEPHSPCLSPIPATAFFYDLMM